MYRSWLYRYFICTESDCTDIDIQCTETGWTEKTCTESVCTETVVYRKRCTPFGLVTKHACDGQTDRQTDGQNYDSQDRANIARAVTRIKCRNIMCIAARRQSQIKLRVVCILLLMNLVWLGNHENRWRVYRKKQRSKDRALGTPTEHVTYHYSSRIQVLTK